MKKNFFQKFDSYCAQANKGRIRNMGIVAHIDHGKTTFSDSLLLAGGMVSQEQTGQKRLFDNDPQEEARGITIKAANATIFYTPEGSDQEFCISIIDTPGHIDFNSEVVRALRVIDGTYVVICAQEGVKPQTETVLKQCLQEGVRPFLFINKVDRLITQSRMDFKSEDPRKTTVLSTLKDRIKSFNSLLLSTLGVERHPWEVNMADGTVIFGSAYQKWGLSANCISKRGLSFKRIYDLVKDNKEAECSKMAPLWRVALDTVCNSFPSPTEAWGTKLEKISSSAEGDLSSMSVPEDSSYNCFFITKVIPDPHVGFLYLGRVFKGEIVKNQRLGICGKKESEKVQMIYIFRGSERTAVSKATFGQIVAVTGFSHAQGGDTLSDNPEVQPFESLAIMKPVISYSVSPKEGGDLVKFMEAFSDLSRVDSSFKFEKMEHGDEYLVSGVGELHMENKFYEVEHTYKVPFNLGPPTILYREVPNGPSSAFWGKSPRRHNRFLISIAPMPATISSIFERRSLQGIVKRSKDLVDELVSGGMPRDEARRIMMVERSNVLVDRTKGAQFLDDIMDSIVTVFGNICSRGLFSGEKIYNLIIYMDDLTIHQTKEHRRAAEIVPAFFRGFAQALSTVGSHLLEPYQLVDLTCDSETLDNLIGLVNQKEGEVLEIESEGSWTQVKFVAPVALMMGFSKEVRDACRGKVSWNISFDEYRRVPDVRESQLVQDLRKKRGLSPRMPEPEDFQT